MSNVDLLFKSPLDTSKPVDLTFNAALVAPPDRFVLLSASIPAPTLAVSLAYDNAVFRGVSADKSTNWQVATPLCEARTATSQTNVPTRIPEQSTWGAMIGSSAALKLPIFSAVPVASQARDTYGDFTVLRNVLRSTYKDFYRVRNIHEATYKLTIAVAASSKVGWQDRLHLPRPERVGAWQSASKLSLAYTNKSGSGRRVFQPLETAWQEARKVLPGKRAPSVLPPVVNPCYTPPLGGAVDFVFKDGLDQSKDLIFICLHGGVVPPATKIIPIQRAYIVINDVHLTRLDDGLELPAYSMSLSIDMDSWTWGFTASLPADQLANLEPAINGEPVSLTATINGQDYTVLAENISRDRVFANSRITVSGRGHSAVLSDPYSPILTFNNASQDRTAQQLMNDALTVNGVSLGWDIDWRIDDWLVPQGAWSLQGSYMQAVTAIAQSVGAFVQPDEIAKTLRILKRYPVAPWGWSTTAPDYEIPASVITRESVTRSRKPDYNAVYVSGTTSGGVLGRAVRDGTAGDLVAPLITDALITDEIAVRQRALPALADVGARADYSLSMPILAGVGAISPGKLIRYIDNGNLSTGISKSLSITVNKSNVVQLIGVETRG